MSAYDETLQLDVGTFLELESTLARLTLTIQILENIHRTVKMKNDHRRELWWLENGPKLEATSQKTKKAASKPKTPPAAKILPFKAMT